MNTERIDGEGGVPGEDEGPGAPIDLGTFTPAHKTADRPLLYMGNALESFRDGCLLDYRIRLAASFIATCPRYASYKDFYPQDVARDALKIAEELVRIGVQAGYVTPIPADDGALTPDLKAQAKRSAAFQVEQQLEGGRLAQAAAGSVVPAAPGFRRGMNS